MKFLVDVCVGRSVHQWLKEDGYDVANVTERDPKLSDSDILDWAFMEKRILITLDKDFQKLAFTVGKSHSGIIRLPNVQRNRRVELVKTVIERHSEDLLKTLLLQSSRARFELDDTPQPDHLNNVQSSVSYLLL
ncbi:MAG TPA: DUF5615 family PIN-like protein [Thermodesulfovibrionales bacterium]|nr:DUF5615 family PIN-like protein [Thermodesulfovibrionales bacterium]